jgi:hypothetical protein
MLPTVSLLIQVLHIPGLDYEGADYRYPTVGSDCVRN